MSSIRASCQAKSSLYYAQLKLGSSLPKNKFKDYYFTAADVENEGNEFLVSLIDTPGLTDFSVEFTSAMRVVDGTIVVIDSFQGLYTNKTFLL